MPGGLAHVVRWCRDIPGLLGSLVMIWQRRTKDEAEVGSEAGGTDGFGESG